MNKSLLLQTLQRYFGYEQFRLHQEAIIQAVLSGRDVMAIMPTGGGKSICYQLPALLLRGVTIVISPLIALMKDQVDALHANGIPAAFLNSTQSPYEQQHIRDLVRNGEIRILYIAPERLLNKEAGFMSFLKSIPCALFAIDEAHCISSWGHDFRPEYLHLAALKYNFPETPVIALTASADRITQKDILEKLRLHQPQVYVSSFNRANISYHILPKKQAMTQIADYLSKHPDDSGIIYALSRQGTEDIATKLRDLGFVASHYHAGMPSDQRARVQEQFQKDQLKIIVATIAFGMGIDKPNVRFVMHYDVPKNMEGYYQETGRAGRDGLKSDALLYYASGDIMKLQRFIEIEDNKEQTDILKKKLFRMKEFAEQEGCRRQYILNYFGEQFPPYCGSCDFCMSSLEHREATMEAQKFLSAVARTGERFGMDYVIDVLRGSASSRIHDSHKELKTYGIGKDQKKEAWQLVARQLILQGMLSRTEDQYQVLKLNEHSWEILKGEKQVTMAVRKEKPAAAPAAEVETERYHEALFKGLKAVRRELAEKENVPAYIILGDNTLQELATYIPLSYTDLKRISGFGDYKIEKYGAAFLEEIKAYAKAHGLESSILARVQKKEKPVRIDKPTMGNTQRRSLQLFKEGNNIREIASKRGFTEATIENHLSAFIPGGEIKATEIVKPARLEKILDVIRLLKDTRALKPIKDLLDESFTYTEIRIAVAHYNAFDNLKI